MAKETQPNFAKVKQLFFQTFVSGRSFIDMTEVMSSVLLNRIAGKYEGLTMNSRQEVDQFIKDFNEWLDHVDIRCASDLIDEMKKRDVTMPAWMKNKRYVIDYNKHGHLDLITY